MKLRYLLLLATMLFVTPTLIPHVEPVYAAGKRTIEDLLPSICLLVRPGENLGTGFVIATDQDDVWILTAGHVAKKEGPITCYFYGTSKESHAMQGRVTWFVDTIIKDANQQPRHTLSDLALIKVPISEFKRHPVPMPLKLAAADCKIVKGDAITQMACTKVIPSDGCINGRWPAASRGNIKEVQNTHLVVIPTTPGGHSGAPILNQDSEVIGMVIWTDGTVIGPSMFYKLLQWKSLAPTKG